MRKSRQPIKANQIREFDSSQYLWDTAIKWMLPGAIMAPDAFQMHYLFLTISLVKVDSF